MTTSLLPRRDDFFYPIEQHFDKFFRDFFSASPIGQVKSNTGFPKMNVVEDEGQFILTVAVPGMKSNDLEVNIDSQNVLRIRGKMSSEYQTSEKAEYYVKELRQSAFERQVQLPEYIRGDPTTSLKDGLLVLSWSVGVKDEQVRKILVNSEE